MHKLQFNVINLPNATHKQQANLTDLVKDAFKQGQFNAKFKVSITLIGLNSFLGL